MSGRLQDRRILLTGASSGVGIAAAHALSREGAQLVLVARSHEALDQVAASLPGRAAVIAADLAQRSTSSAPLTARRARRVRRRHRRTRAVRTRRSTTSRDRARGGETRLLDALCAHVPALGDRVMLLVDRWYRTGTEEPTQPGSLWQAPLGAQKSGGIPARDSLLAPLQLGRRMRPSPATPLHFAKHVVAAGRLAVSLGGRLTGPSPAAPGAGPATSRDRARGVTQVGA